MNNLSNPKKPFVLACSRTLIVENFRMYWYIPLLSFAAYFFGGIFPILANRDNIDDYARFLQHSFEGFNAAYLLLMAFLPLIASVTVMSFYHKQDRAIALHSQPFAKSRIFNSQILSGWLMCELPILLTALLYLCFMKECYIHTVSDSSGFYSNDPATLEINIYTAANVLRWLGSTTAMMTFFYGLYTLAGALVGTGIMQVLLSGVFFGALPLILFIANAYCDEFLRGYAGMSDLAENLMLGSNPILKVISHYGSGTDSLGGGICTAYLAAGLLGLILARVAYGKAKLEKVGDSMIFKPVEEVITWLITFVGTTACGMVFYYLAGSTLAVLLVGLLAGLLATFFVVKIIIAKSIKVFHKRNLLSFGAAALICLIFLSFTVFGITGYDKKIPAEDQIEGVYLGSLSGLTNSINYNLPTPLSNRDRMLSDPTFIREVRVLHEHCIDLARSDLEMKPLYSRQYLKAEDFPDGQIPKLYEGLLDSAGNVPTNLGTTLTFRYQLKNGRTFERQFTCYLDDEAAGLLSDLYAQAAEKNFFTIVDKLKQLDPVSIHASIEVYYRDAADTVGKEYDASDLKEMPADYSGYQITLESADAVYGLLAAKDQDIRERDFRDAFLAEYQASERQLAYTDVYFTVKTAKSNEQYNLGFLILQSDAHTLAYLKDLGYSIEYGNEN